MGISTKINILTNMQIFLLVIYIRPSLGCMSSVGEDFGSKAAGKIGESLERSSNQVSRSIERASDDAKRAAEEVARSITSASGQLAQAMNKGGEDLKEAVTQMSGSISELAQSIDVRIDSGDLAGIGRDATQNLKEALIELSENWEMAINTADLKSIGADAMQHLSRALQNINVRLTVSVGVDDNVVLSVRYMSYAGGIAFTVVFIVFIFAMKGCRRCCYHGLQIAFQKKHSGENENAGGGGGGRREQVENNLNCDLEGSDGRKFKKGNQFSISERYNETNLDSVPKYWKIDDKA